MAVKALILLLVSGGAFMIPTYLWYHPGKNITTPQNIQQPTAILNISNIRPYYGLPNGDFDWCEYNYFHTKYIAEPWNTISSFTYSILAIFDIQFYLYSTPNPNYHILLALFLQIIIGMGSTSFHATLRYDNQLFDEIPMQYYVSTYVIYSYFSYKPSTKLHYVSYCIITSLISIISTIIIYNTKRNEFYHYISHCVLMGTFGLFMAICLIMGLLLYNKCENKIVGVYSKWSAMSAIIGCAFWQFDNIFCDYLQHLPFNFPYPHFHVIWHIGSALSCHYYFLTMVAYDTTFKYNIPIKYQSTRFGIPHYFSIKHDKKS
eukprot:274273_1